MQRWRQRLALGLAIIGLVVHASSARAEQGACAAEPGADRDTRLSSRSSRVLDVLASEGVGGKGFKTLKTYLDQPEPEDSQPTDFVFRDYARLTLGAEYIRREQYSQARKLLSRVRLDSPAGVETALLTAHSWQLQGNTDKALKWYVRVSARYRASPRVLQAVLERAHEAADSGDYRLATRLYERVVAKALANVRELAGLTREANDLSEVILDRQSARDSAATVSGQMIRALLRGASPKALPHLQHVINARKQLQCLENELEQLKQEMFQASERQTQAGNFQKMARREKSMIQRRIGSLERELETTDPRAQDQLRRQLKEQRDKLAAVKKRVEKLEQEAVQSQSLERKEGQLTQRRAELKDFRQENRQAVRREMEEVIHKLKRNYLDLAGSGQAGRASLMRSVALNQPR